MNQHEGRTERVAPLFAAQQAALRELMTGMDSDARWVLLLGPDGSGKSTVVQALLDELRRTAATVAVFDAGTSPDVADLVRGLRDQLGLTQKRKLLGDDESVSDIQAGLSALGTALVVVVDDADALSWASVKWLARLAAGEHRTETACYVVLIGSSDLEQSAGRAWAGLKSGRASVRCILAPMTSAEVRRYIDQWKASGSAAGLKFSEAVIEVIETYSQGRPGLIRELCARTVALPITRLTDQVSVDAVVEAAEHLDLSRATGLLPERESQTERASHTEHKSRFERASQSERASHTERGPARRIAGRVALVIGMATVMALLVHVGVTRLAPRLIATSTAWLGVSAAAIDRSASDVVRSPKYNTRREPDVTPGREATTASIAPSTRQRREPPSADKTQRTIAVEPSAQQIAAMMARAREGEVGELTRLVSTGVSPNVRDVGGFTPLMAAVVNDQVPAARALLDRGAEINARARGGLTALMLAIINERRDAVTLLLERGADVNTQSGAGWTALTFAVWKGDAGLVRELLDHGAKSTVIDKQGWRPLDYAAPKPPPTDRD